MNKKLTVLASAIAVAGSAQASFDAGSTFLYVAKGDAASNGSYDTFAVDLGVGGASSAGTFAATGLSAWLGGASANFAVVGSLEGSTVIGGTPTAPSNDDSVISTASSSDDGLAISWAQVQTLTSAANTWLSALNTADDGDGIVSVAASNANAAASTTRDVLFMSNALTDIASSSAIFASTATGDSSASTEAIGSLQVSISGDTITIADPAPIPVPAAAWLFGSALAGLSVVRRRK